MAAESTYVERGPAPALAAIAASVWIQHVGDRPMAQRHEPHGGFEVRCVLGEAPRLLGPLTTATFRDIPASGTVVGVRLRPGVLGGLVGMPADELVDEDVAGPDLWRDLARLTDLLGDAATPRAALDTLQAFVARSAGEPDPLVDEAVRHLMPWRGGGPAALPGLLSISERQLRRRCRAAVGVGPRSCSACCGCRASSPASGRRSSTRAPTSISPGGPPRSATTTRPTSPASAAACSGVPPGEYLAQCAAACSGHDHAASYLPMLRGDGRFVQERRPVPA